MLLSKYGCLLYNKVGSVKSHDEMERMNEVGATHTQPSNIMEI